MRRSSPELSRYASGWLLLALIALVGCDDEEECRAVTDRIQERLDAIPPGPTSRVPEGLEPPEAEGESLTLRVPELIIDAQGSMRLLGESVDSAEGIVVALREEDRALRRLGMDPQPRAIQVWADRSLPFAELERALASLDGYERWLLVTSGGPVAPPPPCPPSMGAACDRSGDPGQRAATLAAAFDDLVEDCEPLVRLFRRIATMEAEGKESAFRQSFLPAVQQCDCDMDMAAIEWVALEVMGGSNPRVGRLRIAGEAAEGTVGDWVAARSGG